MVDWQVTATTIYCDDVDDEVTLMVHRDWSVRCTGYRKYRESGAGQAVLRKRGKKLKRNLECTGPICHRALQYRDKLMAEESARGAQARD
jgi:hypothetical protein